MNDLIPVSMLLKAIDEEAPDVVANYGEYYGSEFGFSRDKLIEIINHTPRIELKTLLQPIQWDKEVVMAMELGYEVSKLKEEIKLLQEKNAQLKEALASYENHPSNVDQCASCYWEKSYNEGNFEVCRKCVSGSEYTPYLDD